MSRWGWAAGRVLLEFSLILEIGNLAMLSPFGSPVVWCAPGTCAGVLGPASSSHAADSRFGVSEGCLGAIQTSGTVM